MRTLNLAAAMSAICVLSAATLAQAEGLLRLSSGCACEQDYCDAGHGGHCRHCGHHHLEGRDPSYNCGCNGSYKYPVPPLSTYHWPGMYSHQLMTDYHSPWRFPPIRPYVEEEPETELAAVPAIEVGSQRRTQPATKSVLRRNATR